ncbi:uncharacterized protein LOC123989041 [Osmia bicornis bicornis]|uniref:uncharacterized protein LOC123988217 n=1 Tax=Osmia bicornis bicornis TaxID=1437191 RepID=UPI001EAF03C8|nr:uncharacterized protein LOC123988217 [Osmia bicornis bicornis]XP_046145716.1 uncharacterized protein LOC123989041 [Osmia bicornis bicornis]
MTQLAGASVGENALKTLWMQRLPTRVQEVLTIIDDAPLDRLAKVADKTMERSALEMAAVAERPPARKDAIVDVRRDQDGDLAAIVKRLSKIETRLSRRQRSPAKRRWYRRRSSSGSAKRRNGLCYFHHRFGSESWKCRQPCAWSGPDKRKSEN